MTTTMAITEGLQSGALHNGMSDNLNNTIFASIQSKFRNEQPAFFKMYQATRSKDSSELISIDEFTQIYKSLWIHLDRLEMSWITDNFSSGIEGKLHWTKFVKRLNILPPSDYNEPDRFLDPLPEPMASIVDILELEIIDRAWLNIIQLHPEIPIDDKGNSLVVRRNRNLEVLCPPSSACKLSTLPTSMASNDDNLFAAYEDGSVVIVSSKSGEEKHSIPVFKELIRHRNQPCSVVQLSNAVSVPSAIDVPVSRVAVAVIYEISKHVDEPEDVVPAKKTAKGKAVVEEVPKTPAREFALHVRIIETIESDSGTRSVGMKVLSDELTCTVTSMCISIDLCLDGKLLTVCHTDKCNVYHMSEKVEVDVPVGGPGLAQVPEEKPTSLMDEPPLFSLVLVTVVSMSDYQKSSSKSVAAEGSIGFPATEIPPVCFQRCISFLLPESLAAQPVVGADANTKKETTKPAVIMDKYALIVLTDMASDLMIIGFSPVLVTVPAPVVPEKKGAPPAEASTRGNKWLLSTYLMKSWRLTGLVSASIVDASRHTLGLGTTDGSVSLWDIRNRSLISVCGKHSSRITALCFAEGVSNHVFSSGAADGTVCFYTVRRVGDLTAGPFEPATQLIDVRQDVPKASVCCLYALVQTSIIICIFNDGTIAAYEGESADLMGKLVLYIGMLAQKMDSRPVPVFDVLQTARMKHRMRLTDSIASFDDGEISDAGISPTDEVGDLTANENEANLIEEFFQPTRSLVFSGADSTGLVVVFSDVAKGSEASEDVEYVRGTYTTNSVIESLCPGISSLIKGGPAKSSRSLPSATELYRILSLSERLNPLISRASIQYVDPSPGTAYTVVDADVTTKRGRGKKTSALTQENLNAHDKDGLIYKAPAPKLGSIQPTIVWNRSSLGMSLLKDLKQKPDAQKLNKRVANRIKQLSIILPSS